MASDPVTTKRRPPNSGSDRNFGLVFAGVFMVVGFWPWVMGSGVRWWALGLAVLFLAAALWLPKLLQPLNRLWFKLGLLLHRVVNPLIMAVLFCVGVLPTGLLMRAFGKDPLRLKWQKDAESYWIARDPPGPLPNTMSKQF